jgi:hypothetical protein
MPEHFFTGTTEAGRVLRLFHEHTAFRTFTDAAGEVVTNPSETVYTGTLGGAPIEISRVSFHGARDGQDAVTVATDQGTFTAVAGEDSGPAEHRAERRRYLEARPRGGWYTLVESRRFEGGDWHFTVCVGNGRLADERIELQIPLARHRLDRRSRTGPSKLRAWRVRHPEVQAFEAVSADGRPGRRRT